MNEGPSGNDASPGPNGRGTVVLVTGTGSDIGAATARAFASMGNSVVCVDADSEAAHRVCRDLADRGGRGVALACDGADPDAVCRTVDTVVQKFGGLDVLVNSAAADYPVSVDEMTIEQWDRVIDVTLRGPFLFCKAAFPIMREQGGGHIVNIAATAVPRTWVNAAATQASKWELVGFGRKLDMQGQPYDIRVTSVIPGDVQTYVFDRFVDHGLPPNGTDAADPSYVADAIVAAVAMPQDSAVGELILAPATGMAWR